MGVVQGVVQWVGVLALQQGLAALPKAVLTIGQKQTATVTATAAATAVAVVMVVVAVSPREVRQAVAEAVAAGAMLAAVEALSAVGLATGAAQWREGHQLSALISGWLTR
jgi:hypothetical protein